MSKEVTYIVFKDDKGNVISTAEESVVRDQVSVISLKVTAPGDSTREEVDKDVFDKHRKKLTSPGR